jgi:hypothetical protein
MLDKNMLSTDQIKFAISDFCAYASDRLMLEQSFLIISPYIGSLNLHVLIACQFRCPARNVLRLPTRIPLKRLEEIFFSQNSRHAIRLPIENVVIIYWRRYNRIDLQHG